MSGPGQDSQRQILAKKKEVQQKTRSWNFWERMVVVIRGPFGGLDDASSVTTQHSFREFDTKFTEDGVYQPRPYTETEEIVKPEPTLFERTMAEFQSKPLPTSFENTSFVSKSGSKSASQTFTSRKSDMASISSTERDEQRRIFLTNQYLQFHERV